MPPINISFTLIQNISSLEHSIDQLYRESKTERSLLRNISLDITVVQDVFKFICEDYAKLKESAFPVPIDPCFRIEKMDIKIKLLDKVNQYYLKLNSRSLAAKVTARPINKG